MSKKENEKKRRRHFYATLIDQIKQDKKAYIVYVVLSLAIVAVITHSILTRRYENLFTGFLALVLLLIPPFVEKSFRVKLPTTLEILAYAFVFCASILGEIGNFYQTIPFWDLMLHALNGFMFAAFGFCLADILNKSARFRFALSPSFLALVAFCFSMTIGVLWEFFEYAADLLLHTDMQKDMILSGIDTVSLPNALGEKVTHLTDIQKSVIYTADGQIIQLSGYLDVGLSDTMGDLFVNFIGAAIFSAIGYCYVGHRGKGLIAGQFIPVFQKEDADQDGDPDQGEDTLTAQNQTQTIQEEA